MQLSEAQRGVQSKNTLSSAPYLCTLQCGWVFAGGEMGGRDEWSGRGVSVVLGMGTGASRDWTLSSGVNRRAGLWAHQECSLLISFKGAWDSLKEKQTSLLEDTDGSYGRFFLPRLALVGRFKAAVQIPNDSICHERSDLRHVSFFTF